MTFFPAALSTALAMEPAIWLFFVGSFSFSRDLVTVRIVDFMRRFRRRAAAAVFILLAADLCVGKIISFSFSSGKYKQQRDIVNRKKDISQENGTSFRGYGHIEISGSVPGSVVRRGLRGDGRDGRFCGRFQSSQSPPRSVRRGSAIGGLCAGIHGKAEKRERPESFPGHLVGVFDHSRIPGIDSYPRSPARSLFRAFLCFGF